MIGLLASSRSYSIDALIACSGLSIGSLDVSNLGIPTLPSAYALRAVTSCRVVLLTSGWLADLDRHTEGHAADVMPRLREQFDKIVAFDQSDPFLLTIPEACISHVDVVLKVNGTWSDPTLNNYVVGAPTPEGVWSERKHARPETFSASSLRKIAPSLPCFFGVDSRTRAATRRLYRSSPFVRMAARAADSALASLARPISRARIPRNTVHFFASMTHVQRAEACRKLNVSRIRWVGGITSVPLAVAGLRGLGMAQQSEDERRRLECELKAEGLLTAPINRLKYQLQMQECKAVLSISGYGELCFRMAEAWSSRRVLVCQDISNARTLYPFAAGRNAVFCRPDLSDLADVIDDIECNFARYLDVAEQGFEDWKAWTADQERNLRRAFEPLYDSGTPSC